MDHNPPGKELLVETQDGICVVKFNRPDQLNAVVRPMHEALAGLWSQLAADPEIDVIVLTGEGRAFSAGGDLAHLEQMGLDTALRAAELATGSRLFKEMLACPLPIIAAVNGPAVGLGCNIALMCDLVYMSDQAFFADPHVSVGLTAGDGGAAYWPLTMSIVVAKELLFFGGRVSPSRALALGLVNEVVSNDELLARALTVARRLADLPPQAVRSTKQAINLYLTQASAGVIDVALAAEYESFDTPEHHAVLAKLQAAATRTRDATEPIR